MIDLNLKNIVFLTINLVFSTLMHYLTSKFSPHLKHCPIIFHSPYLIPHLTSINTYLNLSKEELNGLKWLKEKTATIV